MDSIILNGHQLRQKVQRLAYQIYEDHQDEQELVIAGINGNGFILAREIHDYFITICDIKVQLLELGIDKSNPFTGIIHCDDAGIEGKALVLVDDVLNRGATLIAAVHHFIRKPMKKIKTLVLIDRNHRSFPIAADFVGMSLATTLQEHIEVRSEQGMLTAVVLN